MDPDDPLVKRRPTLNPYFYGGSAILRRLLWDINPQSWISRRRISGLKDRFTGQKAVILCNGPSLNKVDLSEIPSSCFTVGLNKINLLFERTDFRPNCIVAVNPYVIEQNRDFYNSTEIPLFLDSVGLRKGWIRPRDGIVFLHSGGPPNGFAKDCSVSINQGSTVTYVALQLVFHMGFHHIALVGADHNFAVNGPSNKTVLGDAVDNSHFDTRYFANVKWQLPDLVDSEFSYWKARRIFEAYDRRVVNCTVGGKLEVFERLPLNRFIAE
jgi:hypothetical protein